MLLDLQNVTLFGLDTINYTGLLKAASITQQHIVFGNVVLLSEKDVRVSSGEDYSRFILTGLPGLINTDFVLIIQSDGYVLNPLAWDSDFMSYDYIGAPWDDMKVGNGGFSLRSYKFIKTASDLFINDSNPKFHPEDNYSCRLQYNKMIESGITFAPPSVAKNFSMEANPTYGYKWNGQFGFHNDRITDISDYENFT